ncbi:MAG TPA: hypothetical protein VNO70_01595 [Blastocatellia bacterium]|nr:hypothetical protein [Blastocatellia bacterium]
MSKENVDAVLDAARKLPPEEQRQLLEQLMKEISPGSTPREQAQASLDIVEQTRGTIKNLDRETVMWLAEDEESCGY